MASTDLGRTGPSAPPDLPIREESNIDSVPKTHVIAKPRLGNLARALVVLLAAVPIFGLSARPADAKQPSQIACFHERTRTWTGEEHPSECDIRGYRGRGKQDVARFPVKGMNWGHWGVRRPRAADGVNTRSGFPVRVIAFHPVACGAGETWYSEVVVTYPANGTTFGFRLPICLRQRQNAHDTAMSGTG
jgi:hypothetical protein